MYHKRDYFVSSNNTLAFARSVLYFRARIVFVDASLGSIEFHTIITCMKFYAWQSLEVAQHALGLYGAAAYTTC